MRLLDISIDLIHRIPVAQRSFQHERARVIHYSGRIQRSINQYLIDLAPGDILTDGYLRMDNQAILPCRCTIIHGM